MVSEPQQVHELLSNHYNIQMNPSANASDLLSKGGEKDGVSAEEALS